MARPERPLDPAAGPVQAFAADLRKLRQDAGNPKYLQMQRLTGRSRTSLAEAAGGDHLATWETVEAYVRACGGNLAEWETRWTNLRETTRVHRGESTAVQAIRPANPPMFRRPVSFPRRSMTRIGLAAVVAAAALAVYALRSSAGPVRTAAASRPVIIVVQNMVATGPSALTEDSTTGYLSAKPIPFCAEQKCEVPGTRMWSGAVLQAICTIRSAEMTNENLHSMGIAHNKGGVTSSLWYRAEMSNGTVGYLSEVYIAPAYRGGLGLPTCSP
jgi:hypothetical protein